MTTNDFKKLLDEALQPVKQSISQLQQGQIQLTSDVKELKSDFNELKSDVKTLTSDFNGLKGDFNELKNTVETRVLPSLTFIETTTKGYADMYFTNEDHIHRLDKRVHTVEDKLGIQAPEDLTIPHLN